MRYRKWGRSVRWENGVVVRVEEAGEAWEEEGVFHARPSAIPSVARNPLPAERVIAQAEEILRCAHDDAKVERLVIVHGVADHEYDGTRWSDETRSVHVALTRRPWRILLDDAGAAGRVADALVRCEGEKDFEHLRLSLPVTRGVLDRGVSVPLEQAAGGHDGIGRPIERHFVEGPPPNLYRPSYRVRPVPAWLNLRALPFGTFDTGAPEAIALVDAPLPRALVDDGGRIFVAPLRLDRVTAVSERGEIML